MRVAKNRLVQKLNNSRKSTKNAWRGLFSSRRTSLIVLVVMFIGIGNVVLLPTVSAAPISLLDNNLDTGNSVNASVVDDSMAHSKRGTKVVQVANPVGDTSGKAAYFLNPLASGTYNVCLNARNISSALAKGTIAVTDYNGAPVDSARAVTKNYSETVTSDYAAVICFDYVHDGRANVGISVIVSDTVANSTFNIGSISLTLTGGLPTVGNPAYAWQNRFGIAPGGAIWPSNFQLNNGTFKNSIDAIAASGAKWIRMIYPWQSIEPTNGDFTAGLAKAQQVTTIIQADGLNIVALLDQPPLWSTGVANSPCTVPFVFNITDYADYADHLSSTLSAYPSVKAFEMGNEPNHAKLNTWGNTSTAHPDPCEYDQLARATYAKIHAADPSAVILSAGMGGTKAGGFDLDPDDFLTQMYNFNSGNSNNLFDAIAYHPYSYPNSPLQDLTGGAGYYTSCNPTSANAPGPIRGWCRMLVARTIMLIEGDSAKKIWMTEYGVGTYPQNQADFNTPAPAITAAQYDAMITRFVPPDIGVTPNPMGCFANTPSCNIIKANGYFVPGTANTQASMIAQAYQTVETYDWAGPVFYFDLTDTVRPQASCTGTYDPVANTCSTGQTNAGDFMGLIDANNNPKPAYNMYQTLEANSPAP